MSAGRVERRLAANVARRSRLVDQDEVGPVARLEALRGKTIDLKIVGNNDQIGETAGARLVVGSASIDLGDLAGRRISDRTVRCW